jgi:hypothetical protein
MKNKLLEKYREKVGEPNPNDQNQGQIDLKLLGAIDPQFAAAQSLDALLHPQQQANHDRTIQVQDAIAQQTQSFIDDLVQATTELLYPMPRWTSEAREKQREKQSQLIYQQRPWQHSTGPQSETGKAIVAQNALKHGLRTKKIRELQSQIAQMNRDRANLYKLFF